MFNSVVKEKLKEAEESDPGYVTILGKSIHRNSNALAAGVVALVIVGCAALAVLLPKLMGMG